MQSCIKNVTFLNYIRLSIKIKAKMEKEKYYTPTIEEFHVGFEYEVLAGNEWVNTKIHVENINLNMDRVINHIETCRVKHLDKSDIESLGLILDKTHSRDEYFDFRFPKKILGLGTGDDKTIFVQTNSLDCEICIYTKENRGCEDIYFNGVIKNISELINQLKRCNFLK